MFSVVGEALTIALTALPAILKIELVSSNAALSPVLALCIALSAALAVHFSYPQDEVAAASPQQPDVGQKGCDAARGHCSASIASSPTQPHDPSSTTGLAATAGATAAGNGEGDGSDLGERRDPARLPELSLDAPPERRDSSVPMADPPATRSTKNGQTMRHRAEARRDAAGNISGRNFPTTTN
ncbi:unnamed protein product, partial [Scytosiphon promiscuus]